MLLCGCCVPIPVPISVPVPASQYWGEPAEGGGDDFEVDGFEVFIF